jgi:transcriptional regulator with GAF, ATPase, and Fis domain
MRVDGQVLGVIEVLNKRLPAQLSKTDLLVLEVFANLAASAALNARRHEDVERANRGLRASTARKHVMVGDSPRLQEAMKLVERVAPTMATVLLLGPTGTGKEVTARAIHDRSTRAHGPFVAINCAALSESLLESELFGHEAGAFTGANQQKAGCFELADGGTLFLDEIGEISNSTQTKLLRVLQEREFARVGGTRTIRTNARIVAATNRDLTDDIRKGRFREDLYYRLNVFPITLPPLGQRREDIPKLAEHFCRVTARELGRSEPAMSPEAIHMLCAYSWPGNIRELRNVIERVVLLYDEPQITPAHLPPEITASLGNAVTATPAASVEEFEKAMIVRALKESGGNQSKAARALGMSRDNLRYRLKKYAISEEA